MQNVSFSHAIEFQFNKNLLLNNSRCVNNWIIQQNWDVLQIDIDLQTIEYIYTHIHIWEVFVFQI